MKKILKLFLLLFLTSCGITKGPTAEVETPPKPDKVTLEDIYRPYAYSAKVVEVYDGDTFTLDFEIGFNLRFEDVIRLARVDTPELRGEERAKGIEVRDHVADMILNKRVIATTEKDGRGKYGRLITEIYYYDLMCNCWENLSNYLLGKQMADPY